MAVVAPVAVAPVVLPSWRGRSHPSVVDYRPTCAVAAVPGPAAAAAVTAAAVAVRQTRGRLGRRGEGRPVSVVVEETNRHELEGALGDLAGKRSDELM